MSSIPTCDVIVIGGGHAGTEAALAAARAGAETLLLTHNVETIGQMSCNPAIGGLGKSHLVTEIDALGGAMAAAADAAGIHFRVLNSSKGPAVRATRAQTDRQLYRMAIRRAVEGQARLRIFQQGASDVVIENGRARGVVTQTGLVFPARAVVLTSGTFLGGVIHVGDVNYQGGRAGDAPANALAARLRELPFAVGRLKTGTPPRIAGDSVDFSKLEPQPGDDPRPVFSFIGSREQHPEQRPCHVTRTNERTHEIIRAALHRSPMYNGAIESVGPRYCPSIEDKVVRFADKPSHRIFVEPEGLQTNELYPNGISTSLPFDVQLDLVRSISGFANAHVTRPGYAIEYDYFEPRGLHPWLETRPVRGLFFAGQINGTTGYEEAAAQGLIAGLNAARRARELEPWYPRREQAYIGVLIDDLVTRGTDEPYRMFTSRAEYRLLLRQDNADLRLTPAGRELGLVDDARWRAFVRKRDALAREQKRLHETLIQPKHARAAGVELTPPPKKPLRADELLRRPEIGYADVVRIMDAIGCERPAPGAPETDERVVAQIEIQAKYAGYLDRQRQEIERLERFRGQPIPDDFDYDRVRGLSTELRGKLIEFRPRTLGQAGRLQGMTPAALSLLQMYLKSRAAG